MVISNQIIEGGVDSVVFENYIYHTLASIRNNPDLAHRQVVLLMDNVNFHHSEAVIETARMLKVNVLFNAEYSPQLNPIEQYFRVLKQGIKSDDIRTR